MSSVALDVAIVSGVSLVLGLFRLGTPSIWVDESFTVACDGLVVPRATSRGTTGSTTRSCGRGRSSRARPSGRSDSRPSSARCSRAHSSSCWDVGSSIAGSGSWPVSFSQPIRSSCSGRSRRAGTRCSSRWRLAHVCSCCAPSSEERGCDWALYGLAFAAVVVWHPVAGSAGRSPRRARVPAARADLSRTGCSRPCSSCALAVPWAAQIAMRSTGEGVAMNWLTFPTGEVATRALLDVAGATGLGALLGSRGSAGCSSASASGMSRPGSASGRSRRSSWRSSCRPSGRSTSTATCSWPRRRSRFLQASRSWASGDDSASCCSLRPW